MRMQREPRRWRNVVFVNDAQRTKPHPLRVVKLIERKSMFGIEPAVIPAAAFLTSPYVKHDEILLLINSITYRCGRDGRDSRGGGSHFSQKAREMGHPPIRRRLRSGSLEMTMIWG